MSGAVTTSPLGPTLDSASAAASPALITPSAPAGPNGAFGSNQEVAAQLQGVSYASLIGLLLIVGVCSSGGLFCFVLAGKMHVGGMILFVGAQLTAAALAALWFSIKKWRQINSSPERNGIRSLTIAAVCIEVMFLSVAAGMGMQLGAKRAGYRVLIVDWAHLKEVGRRISVKRNSVAQEIPAYLDMYQSIAADVTELQATTARLLEEEDHFQAEYPEYRPNATQEISHLRITQQRTALLQQQIQVAAKIALQDEQKRFTTWRNEMAPILEQEDALDRRN